MSRAVVAGAFSAILIVFVAVAVGYRSLKQDASPSNETPSATTTSPTPAVEPHAVPEDRPGFLYGRITTVDGATYEGRLRWGQGEEAFWGDYFNGVKDGNPWADRVPPERLPKRDDTIGILGIVLARRESDVPLGRQFMARFGDIARVDTKGRDVIVTLKSGTVFDLDRFEASDSDDSVRVWDRTRGVVDFDGRQIRTVELLPTPALGDLPYRLQGTVRTRHGDFTGFIQWDREKCVGDDELVGHTAEGEVRLRFDGIRSIAERSRAGSLVTMLDGREIGLSDTGHYDRGLYVDDPRYGRVLISWDAFERVDFVPGGSGPAYGDFPPGTPLEGTVTTLDGGRLAGRLVYDLDESESTATLDAPSEGVDYTIPFGMIASIVNPGRDERDDKHATVSLRSGEDLRLERLGDLGGGNAGLLVFVDGKPSPEYVPWADVARVDLDRPVAMYPPLGS